MKIINQNIAVLGVDLGGTNLRVGKVENGDVKRSVSHIVPNGIDDPQYVINALVKAIEEVFDNEILCMGIGIPSLVDKEKGIVYDVQNIPSWKKINLKDILENKFKVSVMLDNDANCFALGERLFGKGKNSMNFVGLTIGTGIGAGIINNGSLLNDANCGSGEFGMLPYLDATFEDYCSGKFFENKHNISGIELYKKALNNDPHAINIFNEFGNHVGNIIKAIMYTIDPEKVIIGGSIAKAKNFYMKKMLEQLADFPYSNARKNIEIEFSELEHAAILGAAALCLNYTKQF